MQDEKTAEEMHQSASKKVDVLVFNMTDLLEKKILMERFFAPDIYPSLRKSGFYPFVSDMFFNYAHLAVITAMRMWDPHKDSNERLSILSLRDGELKSRKYTKFLRERAAAKWSRAEDENVAAFNKSLRCFKQNVKNAENNRTLLKRLRDRSLAHLLNKEPDRVFNTDVIEMINRTEKIVTHAALFVQGTGTDFKFGYEQKQQEIDRFFECLKKGSKKTS